MYTQAWIADPKLFVRFTGTFVVISQGLTAARTVNQSGLRVTLGGGAVITCNYV